MKTFISITLLFVCMTYLSCKDSTDLNPNTAPVAKFTFSPSLIDTSTIVLFNAVGSADVEDLQSDLKFRWDFEGKMNWTEPSSSSERQYRYLKAGTYEVGLKVIDTEGWSGETYNTVIVLDSI